MTFLTEYTKDGKLFADDIEAPSWEEAQILATFRRQDEVVIGELVEEITISEN